MLTYLHPSILSSSFLQELFSIADEICLQVPDVDVLIDKLNVAGYLLKKGHRQYQVTSVLRTYLLLHFFHIDMSRNCVYWDT